VYSTIVILILLFASDYIESFVGVIGVARPLQIASLLFVFLAVSNICSALFQRNGDIVFIGKVQAFATIFGNVCITIPLLWFDLGYWSILIGIFVTELISLIVILWQGKYFLRFSIAKVEAIEVIKYSSAFLLQNIMGLISKQIDIALVGRYLGKTDLGNYSRSMQLIEFPSQIYWLVVDRVVFPSMSAMKSEKDNLRKFFLDIYSLLLLILGIGSIILFFGANEIIGIIMGKGWGVVAVLLEILAANVVLKCITGFLDSFLSAYGTIKVLTYKNIVSLVVFSISMFIGVRFGLSGVAYAVVFANVINFLMSALIAIYYAHISADKLIMASTPACLTVVFVTLLYAGISLIITMPDLVCILLSVTLWALFCFFIPSQHFLSLNGKNFIMKMKLDMGKSNN
ncbi:oligosaccharide flippase family protein, partial [Psychromonas antarctica]|uniref:oligosaccharide flippase family protein n=1 Tax=Psychromonas antarctica TaxID=67573 RepID=UPI001EE8719E